MGDPRQPGGYPRGGDTGTIFRLVTIVQPSSPSEVAPEDVGASEWFPSLCRGRGPGIGEGRDSESESSAQLHGVTAAEGVVGEVREGAGL